MRLDRVHGIALTACLASLVLALPVLAEELRGTVKSVDRDNSRMVVHDEMAQRDVVVNFNKLTALKSKDAASCDLKDVKPGVADLDLDSVTASRVTVDDAIPTETEQEHDRSSRSSGTTSGTTCSSRCCSSSTWGSWSRSCG